MHSLAEWLQTSLNTLVNVVLGLASIDHVGKQYFQQLD